MKTIGKRMPRPLMAALCAVVWSSLTHTALAGGNALIDFTAPPTAAYERQHDGGQPTTLGLLRSDSHVSELKVGELSQAAIAGAVEDVALTVRLPNGETLEFVALAVSETDGIVRLKGSAYGGEAELSVLVDGEDVLGYIESEGVVWRLTPLGGGATAVYRQAPHEQLPHPPAMRPPEQGTTGEMERIDRELAPVGDLNTQVDVLVVYTERAALKVGSNLRAHALGEIDKTNDVFENSNLPVLLHLIDVHTTTAPDHDDLGTSLVEITLKKGECWATQCDPHGRMDEVHEIRDQLGADLVALITAPRRGRFSGLAWSPHFQWSGGATRGVYGFSVAKERATGGKGLTLAHEIVHNFGGDHDPDMLRKEKREPAYEYGQGFVSDEDKWATLMAYPPEGHDEIPYLSSPEVRYEGRATGNPQQDNRRVVAETVRFVSAFRNRSALRATLGYVLGLGQDRQTFMRFINPSERTATVQLRAWDDDGRDAGTTSFRIGPRESTHRNSNRLAQEGLLDQSPKGHVEVWSSEEVDAHAYMRTSDGMLAPVTLTATEWKNGPRYWYYLPTVNPSRNDQQVSRVRVVNPGASRASGTLHVRDDAGDEVQSEGRILEARSAFEFHPEDDLGLKLGKGKRQVWIESTQPLLVMSLMHSRGYVTNLSQ